MMLDIALRYATRWAVFPVKAGQKIPACEHGCRDATRDPEQIRRWWAREDHNIGIATGEASDLWVLDIDGEEGMDALLDLGQGMPGTLTAYTPSGGLHLFFRYPGGKVGNTARKLGDHIDSRGEGGYVVGAPSLHPNGGRYRWAGKGVPKPVPGWLLRMVRPAPEPRKPSQPAETKNLEGYVRKAVEGEREAVVTAMEGSRNHALNAAAFSLGTLVGAGALDAETVYDVLMGAAREAGLTERESRRTIASGLSSGQKNPRVDVS